MLPKHDPSLARYFPGKNLMTPTVLCYFKRGAYLFEVSTGRGIFSPEIFGVTVVSAATLERAAKLSKGGFPTLAQAMAHVESLTESEEA